MASISTKDFVTLVSQQVQAIQGVCSAIIDFTIGSIMRGIVESNAAVVLWLQGMILQLVALTRAATSSGADLDSWVGDFGVTRLPAVAASGQVTFARFTPTNAAFIPVGINVETTDGSQIYTVIADTNNGSYSPSLGGYPIGAGIASISVTVQDLTAGAAGNAGIGMISVLASAVPGVDTVSNAAPFSNGADAESDAALRTRFVNFIASLSKATKNAIGYAITSLKIGATYNLTENFAYNGTPQPGYFYVVVDDGSGTPPGSFLSAVASAVDAVRPVTSTFGVFAPTLVTANVILTISVSSSYTLSAIEAIVQAAIVAYIDSLPIGGSLTLTRLAQIAYDASPGVINVTGVTLNSGTADLVATSQQMIKAGTVAVN